MNLYSSKSKPETYFGASKRPVRDVTTVTGILYGITNNCPSVVLTTEPRL